MDIKRRWSWKKRLALAFTGLFLAILTFAAVIAVWDWRNFASASDKLFGSSSISSLISPSELQTDNSGRINILLAGYSVDDPGHQGANLTDSIMLVSLDPSSNSGYMLSIPRDLYTQIPGYGYAKINEAYRDGGIRLLEQVVNRDFNTDINYYAIINYAAVRDTVNALDGIRLCIHSPDPRGLYDPNISKADGGPLKLSNGCHKLNGQTALNLTRARGEPAPDGRIGYGFPRSDFDRTTHQRQVLSAIKQKVNLKLLLDPRKNSGVFNAVANNIKTDIELSEVRPLYSAFKNTPDGELKSISLNNVNGQNLLIGYITPGGLSALIPAAGLNDYSQIQAALNRLQ